MTDFARVFAAARARMAATPTYAWAVLTRPLFIKHDDQACDGSESRPCPSGPCRRATAALHRL